MKTSTIDSKFDVISEKAVRELPLAGAYPPKIVDSVTLSGRCTIELIDSRVFERECVETSIGASHPSIDIFTYDSVTDWADAGRGAQENSAVLYNIGGARVSDARVRAELVSVIERAKPSPVLVLAVSEHINDLIEAIDAGARGYIPSSVSIAVMIGATRLAITGGIFLPPSSIVSMRDTMKNTKPEFEGVSDFFTSRQSAVADALRRGKANKIIAYELNMCESTVKVHIRTIMKKTKSRNRTEAAFKLNQLFPPDPV